MLNTGTQVRVRFSPTCISPVSVKYAPTPILKRPTNNNPDSPEHRRFRKKWKYFSRILLRRFTVAFSQELSRVSLKCIRIQNYYVKLRFQRWHCRYKWVEMAHQLHRKIYGDNIRNMIKSQFSNKSRPQWKTMYKLLRASANRRKLFAERDSLALRRRLKKMAKWSDFAKKMRPVYLSNIQKLFSEKRQHKFILTKFFVKWFLKYQQMQNDLIIYPDVNLHMHINLRFNLSQYKPEYNTDCLMVLDDVMELQSELSCNIIEETCSEITVDFDPVYLLDFNVPYVSNFPQKKKAECSESVDIPDIYERCADIFEEYFDNEDFNDFALENLSTQPIEFFNQIEMSDYSNIPNIFTDFHDFESSLLSSNDLFNQIIHWKLFSNLNNIPGDRKVPNNPNSQYSLLLQEFYNLILLYPIFSYYMTLLPDYGDIPPIFENFNDMRTLLLTSEMRLNLSVSSSLAYFESCPQFKLNDDVKTDVSLSFEEFSKDSMNTLQNFKDQDIPAPKASPKVEVPLFLSQVPEANTSSLSCFTVKPKIKEQKTKVNVPLELQEIHKKVNSTKLTNFRHYIKRKPNPAVKTEVPLSFSKIVAQNDIHLLDFEKIEIPEQKGEQFVYMSDLGLSYSKLPFAILWPIIEFTFHKRKEDSIDFDECPIINNIDNFSCVIPNNFHGLETYKAKELPAPPEENLEIEIPINTFGDDLSYEEEEEEEEILDVSDIDFDGICCLDLDVPIDITNSMAINASMLDSTQLLSFYKGDELVSDLDDFVKNKLQLDEMFDIDEFDTVYNTLLNLDIFTLSINPINIELEASKRMMAKTRFIPYIFQFPLKFILPLSTSNDPAVHCHRKSIHGKLNIMFKNPHSIMPKTRFYPSILKSAADILYILSLYCMRSRSKLKPDSRLISCRMIPKVRFVPHILEDIQLALLPLDRITNKSEKYVETINEQIEFFNNTSPSRLMPKSRFSPSLFKAAQNNMSSLSNYSSKSTDSLDKVLFSPVTMESKEPVNSTPHKDRKNLADKTTQIKKHSRHSSKSRNGATSSHKKEKKDKAQQQFQYSVPDFVFTQIEDAFCGAIHSISISSLEKIKFPRKHAPKTKRMISKAENARSSLNNDFSSPIQTIKKKLRVSSEKKRKKSSKSNNERMNEIMNSAPRRKSKRSHISSYMIEK
ncbi:hypothetical protein TRFO_08847 [Tritrichomonas foetus]|uniref:Uncharacterized protein n=1 Tax=Tritrichomonas foetus TaxID=1144522 RepID=A0A1J4JHD4_9EUKA|nr:hypothetical protein TRFO_08847 [Tritrichomonas foetus]|eukprot:OHS98560.1 hypothetical protein TRFO_08847 [Tritrichomonas foetus]